MPSATQRLCLPLEFVILFPSRCLVASADASFGVIVNERCCKISAAANAPTVSACECTPDIKFSLYRGLGYQEIAVASFRATQHACNSTCTRWSGRTLLVMHHARSRLSRPLRNGIGTVLTYHELPPRRGFHALHYMLRFSGSPIPWTLVRRLMSPRTCLLLHLSFRRWCHSLMLGAPSLGCSRNAGR